MPQFALTLALTVEADTLSAAYEVGVGAAEHLADTFNDDGSLSPVVGVNVRPEGAPDPAREALHAAAMAHYGRERAQAAACYRDELVTLHAAALALVRKLQSMPGIHASHYAELAGLLDAA